MNRCATAIRGAATPIQLGFVRRFDPGHKAVHDAVSSGALGDLHQVAITSRDPGLAPEAYLKVSGGIFRDMTIHDFDMARFILDEEPEVVFATASRLVAPALMEKLGDYDTVTVVLTTASGKQAVITNSREAVYGYDQRVEASRLEGNGDVRKPAAASDAAFRQGVQQLMRRPSCTSSSSATGRPSTRKSTPSSKRSSRIGRRSSVSRTGGGPWRSQRRALKSVAEGRAVKISEVL